MKQTTLFLWMVVLCIVYAVMMHAELLIVQKGDDGRFIPLPAKNADESVWGPIKQYQWPQCIINSAHMSEQEKTDLLLKGSAYAEERFIQNKLSQLGEQYQVVFVPTALYELFCIFYILKTMDENNPLQDAFKKMGNSDVMFLGSLIDQQDSFANIMKNIYEKYNDINGYFFVDGSWGYINNKIAQFLFSYWRALPLSENAFAVSENIKNTSKAIVKVLIKQLSSLPVLRQNILVKIKADVENNEEQLLNIIGKVIDLEYEARESNSALLLRGSSLIRSRVGFDVASQYRVLGGSTIVEESPGSLEKQYTTKQIAPFSISFANSLFAGAFYDKGACAYYYLMGEIPTAGYALFIDKKAYVEHRIQNLFFISPLMSLAALLERGEYFHSRTTAAISIKGKNDLENKKEYKKYKIKGLAEDLTDPRGVLLITRDPLRHAELFSQYLARHGRILQAGSLDELTGEEQKFAQEEEQKFAQEVLNSQKEAAQFYQTTRNFKRAVDRKAQRMRRRSRKALVEPKRGGKRTAPVAEEEALPKRIKIEQEKIPEKQEEKEEVQESEVMKEEEEMEEGEDE